MYVELQCLYTYVRLFVAHAEKNAGPIAMEVPTLFVGNLRSVPVKFPSIRLTATIWAKSSTGVDSFKY